MFPWTLINFKKSVYMFPTFTLAEATICIVAKLIFLIVLY